MVETRGGANISATDAMSPMTLAAASSKSMMEKAKANKTARLANETLFDKFDDGPRLNELIRNFDAWNVYPIEVTTEKMYRQAYKSTWG